ncbi:sulfate transporter family-domain-containing protein [Roridomyces roridus]|uniref:Sulfate transporter family-domain-containing protein n=1 Tax=Roridomyces roridus TaxID=1738132 RepID=A0AAD7FWN7_9AGAR|nr:sulfate transporter family-domain-containing protein [Roridomyces roridus]
MSVSHTVAPHSQDSIRLNTMQLSGLEMGMFSPPAQPSLSLNSPTDSESDEFTGTTRSGSITPRNRMSMVPGQPSGLSLMRPAPDKRDSFPSIHSMNLESTPEEPQPPITLPTTKTIGAYASTTLKQAVRALPAVVLGCLLNILDGVSYGMIIFPTSDPFADLGPMGVSMFFVSCVIAQFVYTLGASGIACANGSMMIEVVPFFHILAASIATEIGLDHPQEIIATTLVAFALSSVLTGLTFFLLGYLKLGTLIGFFPRHILVGCIGGVGAFLIETGLTVSLRISDDDFTATWETFRFVFLDPHNLALWTIPLALAILLRFVTEGLRWRHQLVFPIYFLIIPVIFYVVVAAAQLDIADLRAGGWVFDIAASGSEESWYKFYTYYDFSHVRFGPLWATIPTQFALLFFNILHPPLNVPALAVSLNEDVDTDKELVAHGYSNFLSGILGTVPNYLVYVNTLLFYRVGGETRVAGFLLGLANIALLLIGTGPIAYIPVMVVGALIFVLGIDLCKEALWDTRHRVSRSEYITIVSIMVCMTVWDFVIGVLFGIVVSCFFFVVQNSQRSSIRALHTGETAISTVRRPSSQRAYIREVSKQTTILRLQGFLFFGTITHVEETIRGILQPPAWQRNPVRFLVLDLSLVGGVDMSAAEAFVRVQRLLAAKYITLVFCGFQPDSPVAKALESVDVLGAESVELFSTFNDAMEWTENAYLQAWFRSQKAETSAYMLPGQRDANIAYQQSLAGSLAGSPRRSHLRDTGRRTIADEIRPPELDISEEPYNTLVKVFSSHGDVDLQTFRPMLRYLQRMSVPKGLVLWKQGDPADGLYIIESGVLRASYQFSEHAESIEESMVPGTIAGELSALSNSPRNATAVVERPAVVWKLSVHNLRLLEEEEPVLARRFTQLVLKAAKIDHDILLSALAARQ